MTTLTVGLAIVAHVATDARTEMAWMASLPLLLVARVAQQQAMVAAHSVTPPSLPAPVDLKVEGLDAASAVLSTATPVFPSITETRQRCSSSCRVARLREPT